MDYKIKPIRKYEEYEEYEEDCADNGMELLLNSIYDNYLVEEIDEDEEEEYGNSYFNDYNSYYYRKQLLQRLGYSGVKKELANTKLFNGNSKFEVEVSNLPKAIESHDIRGLFAQIGDLYDTTSFYHFREEQNIANFLQRKALHITRKMTKEAFLEHRGFNEYQLLEYAAFAAINNNLYAAINKGLDITNENSTTIENVMPEEYHILVSLFRYFEDLTRHEWSDIPKGTNFQEAYDAIAQNRYSTTNIFDEEGEVIDKLTYKKVYSNCYLATCHNIEEHLEAYIALFDPLEPTNTEGVLENRGYILQLNEETGHIEKIFYVHLNSRKIIQTINIADFQEEYNKLYTALVTLYSSAILYYIRPEVTGVTFLPTDKEEEYLSNFVEIFTSPYQILVNRVEEIKKIHQALDLSSGRFDLDMIFSYAESAFSSFSHTLTDENSAIPFKTRIKFYASEIMGKRNSIEFNISDSEINKLNSIGSLVKQIKFIMDIFRRRWLDADSLAVLFCTDHINRHTTSDAKKIITRLSSTYKAFKEIEIPNAKLVMEEVLKVLKRKSSWQLDSLEKGFSKISSNVQYKDTVKWIFSLEAQDILTASVNDHEWSSCHASSYGNTPMALMSNGITFVIYEEEGDKLSYDIDNKINRTYAHYKEEYDSMSNGEVKRTLVLEGAYPRRFNEKIQKALVNIIAEMTGSTDIDIVYEDKAMFFGIDYDYSDYRDEDYEVPDDFIKCGYYDYFESNSQVGFQDGVRTDYEPTIIARFVPNLSDLDDEIYNHDTGSTYDCLFH